MKDIESRKDLELLLDEFYKVAIKDPQIGHHFDGLDLEPHMPSIVDFWEKVLFGKPVYFGNPMAVHKILHEKSPLIKSHFSRWLKIFNTTTAQNFTGTRARLAQRRAASIAKSLGTSLNGDSVR